MKVAGRLDPGFEASLDADPDDHVTRMVAADWLDERDRPVEAEALRVQAALRLRPVKGWSRLTNTSPRTPAWCWFSAGGVPWAGHSVVFLADPGTSDGLTARWDLVEERRLIAELAPRALVPDVMQSAFYVVAARWVWLTRADADRAWRSAYLNMSDAARAHMRTLAGLAS